VAESVRAARCPVVSRCRLDRPRARRATHHRQSSRSRTRPRATSRGVRSRAPRCEPPPYLRQHMPAACRTQARPRPVSSPSRLAQTPAKREPCMHAHSQQNHTRALLIMYAVTCMRARCCMSRIRTRPTEPSTRVRGLRAAAKQPCTRSTRIWGSVPSLMWLWLWFLRAVLPRSPSVCIICMCPDHQEHACSGPKTAILYCTAL
jgi:hypothetical protein